MEQLDFESQFVSKVSDKDRACLDGRRYWNG